MTQVRNQEPEPTGSMGAAILGILVITAIAFGIIWRKSSKTLARIKK